MLWGHKAPLCLLARGIGIAPRIKISRLAMQFGSGPWPAPGHFFANSSLQIGSTIPHPTPGHHRPTALG
jgi:hypothetical protein